MGCFEQRDRDLAALEQPEQLERGVLVIPAVRVEHEPRVRRGAVDLGDALGVVAGGGGADLDLERPEATPGEALGAAPRVLGVAGGDRDVRREGLPRAAVQGGERDTEGAREGVDDRHLQACPRRRLGGHAASERLRERPPLGRQAALDQRREPSQRGERARLRLSAHRGERRGLSQAERPALEGDRHEHVVGGELRPGRDREGLAEGEIQRSRLHARDSQSSHVTPPLTASSRDPRPPQKRSAP
jgi:hypothetical protein